jgi:putative intracellular protease/amidase
MCIHHLIAALAFSVIASVGLAASVPAPSAQAPGSEGSAGVPPHVPRFGRTRPVVAVVGENRFTELTNYVVPFGVLQASGVADVVALGTQAGPMQMFPALKFQPRGTVAEFDARVPEGADYVIVPAVHHTDDAALLSRVSSQAAKGATIVGVCDGVWVLANAGLLKGHQAVAALGACRTWNVESENRPQRGQFLPDLQAHSPAMGQKDGEKWTAAVDCSRRFPSPTGS